MITETKASLCYDAGHCGQDSDQYQVTTNVVVKVNAETATDDQELQNEAAKLSEKNAKRKALMPFAIISISYLLYTITDGSVRMIVLLHAYNKSFTAMEV